MNTQRIKLLEEALSENGIVPVFATDIPLVNELCEVIGILHRELEARGMTAQQIQKIVGEAQ
jgi:hypothetical protein